MPPCLAARNYGKIYLETSGEEAQITRPAISGRCQEVDVGQPEMFVVACICTENTKKIREARSRARNWVLHIKGYWSATINAGCSNLTVLHTHRKRAVFSGKCSRCFLDSLILNNIILFLPLHGIWVCTILYMRRLYQL